MDKRNEDIVEKIKTQFEVLFRKNGYSTIDSFDYSVFFMQRSIKGKSLREYFEDSLNSTPQEDDDIIKFILMKSFRNSTSKEKRIYVCNFIDEIANQVVSLYNENERIESLINKYNAYEIVNTIDQNKIHFDKCGELTITLNSTAIDDIDYRNIDGFRLLSPTGNTVTDYGYFSGTGTTRPYIEITVTV